MGEEIKRTNGRKHKNIISFRKDILLSEIYSSIRNVELIYTLYIDQSKEQKQDV